MTSKTNQIICKAPGRHCEAWVSVVASCTGLLVFIHDVTQDRCFTMNSVVFGDKLSAQIQPQEVKFIGPHFIIILI